MSWDELVAVALVGTDRRPVEAGAPPGAPAELEAALAGRGAEDRLLASAAAWTVARRAGAQAVEATAVEPAPEDPRPLCSPAAGTRLRSLLLDGEYPELVPEWLARAAQAGLRPPPEVIPDLLEHAAGRAALHVAVAEAAGPLGRWLADREPRWAFVRGTGAADWADGTRPQRRALLARLRRSDPDEARELLASTFKDEPWEDREAFVDILAERLSDADEPFLEGVLDDPRLAVRDAAAALLARLPGSRYAARAAAWVGPLLRVEGGRIVVELPGPPDAAARRDGFRPSGLRAERLHALLATAPLATWSLDLLALPVADDLGPTLLAGWSDAAQQQGNAEWARALWPLTGDDELLAVLPRAEGEALAATADDPFVAALELRGPWGPALSRIVIAAVPRRREAGGHVGVAGYRLDPSLETEVEALRDLGGRDVWNLCDTLVMRAAMLRELA